MVTKTRLPNYNLSYKTRDLLKEFGNKISQRNAIGMNQAVRILKQYILSSLKRIRTVEQLHFIQNCMREKLTTNRIELATIKLDLRNRQRNTLKYVLMNNTKKNIFKDSSTREREKTSSYKKVTELLNHNELEEYIIPVNKEKDFALSRTKQHYKERIQWMRLKQRKQEQKLPDMIDNISFRDHELPQEFESNPKLYGNVKLTENEAQVLTLPPRFAIYPKLQSIATKADVEKTFTKLRWKRDIEDAAENQSDTEAEDECANFYDSKENSFNMSRLRATNLPFNKRVCMPPFADEDTEARIQFAKTKIYAAIDKQATRSKGKDNVNKRLKQGLTSLQQRIKEKEIICFPTDKSGRLSVDTASIYIEGMKGHLKAVVEVDQKEYEHVEKQLNAHMHAWCNILQASERVQSNYQATNNAIPPLYGWRKDHKNHDSIEMGPLTRPVCGAVVSSNY